MQADELKDELLLILEHLDEVNAYFEEINKPEDFISTKQGKAYYDAILMHLQVAGEVLKKCYKENPQLFDKHSEIPWSEIIRLRDLISHHYDKLEYEIVFDICRIHIKPLTLTLQTISSKL
jgi:uncharacterized protein with HEPN domain